jgi:hypothetical protein
MKWCMICTLQYFIQYTDAQGQMAIIAPNRSTSCPRFRPLPPLLLPPPRSQ